MNASGWFAAGKHPCAADFFQVGEAFPLALSLAGWVEAGYQAGRGEDRSARSWRFWAAAGEVVCYGVLAGSRDRLGRPFPLLVAGQNRSMGWQRNWEGIPAALERSWLAMEEITAADCPDLATLQAHLCAAGREAPAESRSPAPPVAPGGSPIQLEQEGDLVSASFPPGEISTTGVVAAADAAMKLREGRVPASVFIGGLVEAPRIIFFYRPIATRDFTSLWGGGTEAGDGATC